MTELRYEAPETLDAAVTQFSGAGGSKLMAGGTDVLVQLHTYIFMEKLIKMLLQRMLLRDIELVQRQRIN